MDTLVATVALSQFRIVSWKQFQDYTISIGPRMHSLDPDVVWELADSIKHMTMLHPIICTDTGSNNPMTLTLVAGWHRLEAIKLLWDTATDAEKANYSLPIRVVSIDGVGDDRRLVELSENLHRRDLSEVEREKLSAMWEMGSVTGYAAAGAPAFTPSGQPKIWLGQWAAGVGVADRTATNIWSEFRKAHGLGDLMAKHATEEHKKLFFEWVPSRPLPRARAAYKPRKGSKATKVAPEVVATLEERLAAVEARLGIAGE